MVVNIVVRRNGFTALSRAGSRATRRDNSKKAELSEQGVAEERVLPEGQVAQQHSDQEERAEPAEDFVR